MRSSFRRRLNSSTSPEHWPLRRWVLTWAVSGTAVLVAVGVVVDAPTTTTLSPAVRTTVLAELRGIRVVESRPASDGTYERAAFGSSWTDAVPVTGGGNGCPTREDVLARDLSDTTTRVTDTCPRTVVTGEFRSPYTGEFLLFSRERAAGAVQIDHVVPLAYAWVMGAREWPAGQRLAFANDPANLIAVDAASNQDKSDAEPARWLPPNRRFHCQYAVAFVRVSAHYRLALDVASRDVLAGVLDDC